MGDEPDVDEEVSWAELRDFLIFLNLPVGILCAVGIIINLTLFGSRVIVPTYPQYSGLSAVALWIACVGLPFILVAQSLGAYRARRDHAHELRTTEHLALLLIQASALIGSITFALDNVVFGVRFTSTVAGLVFLGLPALLLRHARSLDGLTIRE